MCKGDLDFFCSCLATPEHLRLRSHERTSSIPRNLDDLESIEFANVLGTIAEDIHLTRCAQVCFTGTEDDQTEQHDQGTIDEVLGDPDIERGEDAPEEGDLKAGPPEQIPLPGHPEYRPYMFNHEVGIDAFEIIDSVDMRSSTSDAVCMGVTYVQVRIERKSDCSSPSFHTRLQAFVYDWSRQTGWSRLVRYEQETHDGGVSSSVLIKNGVMIRPAGKGNARTNQKNWTTR